MKAKRWVKRAAGAATVLLLLIPLITFGLTNLFLISPKGTAVIAKQLEERLGLEVSIRSARWAPWSGVTCLGVTLEQPAELKSFISNPFLKISSIRLLPRWLPLLKKQIHIKEIWVEGADLTLPIELLLAPSQKAESPSVTAPPLAAVTPNLPHNQHKSTPQSAAPSAVTSDTKKTISAASSPNKRSSSTTWIHFSNSSIKITSATAQAPFYEVSRIEGDIPIGGQPAEGKILLQGISSLGTELSKNFSTTLKWEPPVLSAPRFRTTFPGIICDFEAGLGIGGALPFSLSAYLPAQKEKSIVVSNGFSIDFQQIIGKGQFQGYLRAPMTWQGQWVSEAVNIDVQLGATTKSFQRTNALLVYQQGVLRCIDSKLIGDMVSVLANGAVIRDGRVSANIRFVSSPADLIAISKFTHPDRQAPHLTPLQTPQRSALDIQIFGELGDIRYQPDPMSDVLPISSMPIIQD